MGGSVLSKTLIQLSVDGRSCVPSLLFDLRPNYGDEGNESMEVMKIMATSFKRCCAGTATLSTPDPVAGHCRPTPLLETPGHSLASLVQSLVRSLLLSPGSWCVQGSVCVLQECIFSVMCKFWQLYGGLMAETGSCSDGRSRAQ